MFGGLDLPEARTSTFSELLRDIFLLLCLLCSDAIFSGGATFPTVDAFCDDYFAEAGAFFFGVSFCIVARISSSATAFPIAPPSMAAYSTFATVSIFL